MAAEDALAGYAPLPHEDGLATALHAKVESPSAAIEARGTGDVLRGSAYMPVDAA